jgi:tripartite ATP-independent transporter DctM subunit
MVNRLFKIMSNWVLVALPMFIYMGLMLDHSDVAKKLMLSMQNLFGRMRGGLAVTVTAIGVLLAASTGIIGASVVLLGMLALPSMLEQKYSKELAVGTICSAGTLGILIPPSIMLVVMADQLSISVGDLFMGAVFPGILLSALYFLYILVIGVIHPQKAPLHPERKPLSLDVLWDVFKSVLPPVLLILSVLGSIFAGIATPTEASGIGALGATILAAYNKKLNLKVLKEVLYQTMNTTAFIMAIFIAASCFSLVLRELGGDEFIERLLSSIPFGNYGVILTILAVVFLLGFFLDWIEITLIILPLVAPIIGNMEFTDPSLSILENGSIVWFTLLVAITLQTSFLTPPVGFALFYLKGIAPKEVKLIHIYKGVIPFVILQLVALGIVLLFPKIVTWLPSVSY